MISGSAIRLAGLSGMLSQPSRPNICKMPRPSGTAARPAMRRLLKSMHQHGHDHQQRIDGGFLVAALHFQRGFVRLQRIARGVRIDACGRR